MQYKAYDRQTIEFVDGGFISSYSIDDDYIVNNNSTLSIVKATNAKIGDIIALIQTSGAFHKGVITSVDNSSLTISYKSDKELFNDNFINPLRTSFADESASVVGIFDVNAVALILQYLWGGIDDPLKELPITVLYDGTAEMQWTWSDNSINMVDWLVELFEKYNVRLSWTLDFNISENELSKRNPKIVVTISAVVNGGNLIKDNVQMQSIEYTTEELPDATVCYIISSETKELIKDQVWYLIQKDGDYAVTQNAKDENRMLPVKTKIVEYDENSLEVTYEDTAKSELIPSKYNQAIEIKIPSDSKMFDFDNANFGDLYKIVNENGIINSVYTGRKQTSNNKWVTLYFGLGRKNYTDLIQIRLRKQKYTTVYNQRVK